jgi:hypothetical protein
MSGADTLVVPVNVEAMCISSADAEPGAGPTLAAAGADLRGLPATAGTGKPYIGASVTSDPFEDATEPLVAGVHLHWALPDALTQSTHVYRLTGPAITELRMLGLPHADLVALLRELAAANPHRHDLPPLIDAVATWGDDDFDAATWATLTDPALTPGPGFATPEGFMGVDSQPAVSSMTKVLGAIRAARSQAILVEAAGVARFPSVPDRWAVVRTVTPAQGNAGDTLAQWRAWLVESDFLTTDADDCFAGLQMHDDDPRKVDASEQATTVPAAPGDTRLAYRFLGRAGDLRVWKPDDVAERYEGLTPLGYGLPSFAASYRDSRTALGICDGLADLGDPWTPSDPQHTRLGYVVVGWHSDPADDPLAHGALEDFRWELPPNSTGPAPTRTLYAGAVQGVEWQPTARYLPGGPDPHGTELVVASTAAEALATLLGDGSGGGNVSGDGSLTDADLLEALQLGLLDAVVRDGAAALPNLDAAMHASTFGGHPGGILWGAVPAGRPGGGAEPGGAPTLPTAVAGKLDALHGLQRDYEAKLAAVTSKRGRLFTSWHLLLQLGADTNRDDDAIGVLTRLLSFNSQAGGQPGTVPADVVDLRGAAVAVAEAAEALAAGLPKELRLQPGPGPRHSEPAEPVLLLSGPAAQPSQRYGADGLDSPTRNLRCRRLDQLLDPGSTLATLTGSPDWPLGTQLAPHLDGGRRPELMALVCDALLVDQGMVLPGGLDRTALLAQVERDATAPVPTYAHVDGIGWPPARNARNDRYADGPRNAWDPIALHWSARVRPQQAVVTDETYDADLLSTQAELGDVDLRAKAAPDPKSPAESYAGTSTLTARAAQTLAAQAAAFLGMGNVPPQLQAALQKWANRTTPVLSQALTGFNNALLMRTDQLQLRVHSPDLPDTAAQVAPWIGSANRGAPKRAGAFNPLRFGALNLDRVRIVDAFGQTREVPIPTDGPTVAPSLALDRPPGKLDFGVGLPPRFSQPTRLLLRWLSAADDSVESNDHPATSPVCAWVLPNHLDVSLMLFEADGTALGEVRRGLQEPVWVGAPGGAPQTASNPHLEALRQSLVRRTNDGLAALMQTLETVTDTIEPATHRQHDALAVLMGRPLALARASLAIDADGPYARNQSVDALASVSSPDLSQVGGSGGVEHVEVAVRLGDLALDADGLVGFFTDDVYDRFTPTGPDACVPITLEATPKAVSLLLDPRGAVHATSGLLPVASVQIPPEQYDAALAALRFSFLAAPVIDRGATSAIELPLPAESVAPWSWIERAGTQWQAPVTPKAATGNAALDAGPRRIREGWLSVQDHPNEDIA